MPSSEFIAAFSAQTDNGAMLRPVFAAALFALAACSSTFNWREVRADSTALKAMLPCKPDRAARTVPMAGRQVELRVLGCEAGGATFAVLTGDIGEPLRQSLRVAAGGQRGDGSKVESQAVYFARGSQVVQAVIMPTRCRPRPPRLSSPA